MPHIHIEIYGHYADLAGASKFEVETQPGTVGGLVAEMKRAWPRGFVEAVLDEEGKEFNLGVLVMVNSSPVYHLQGMDTRLEEGDKVIFLPPMAGGSPLPVVGEGQGEGEAAGRRPALAFPVIRTNLSTR